MPDGRQFLNRLWGGFSPADVPKTEANALIRLYHATDGPNWTDNTNWLTDPAVGNWYGITVAGGHVTGIDLNGNNLSGDASNILDPLQGNLTSLHLYSNSLTGIDVSALISLTDLRVQVNSIPVLDVSALVSLTILRCHFNSLNTLDVSALASLVGLRCDHNSISTLDVSGVADEISYIDCSGNGMAQAAVDTIIGDIWSRRDDWTDATPELNVGGTNATPTGTYQDGYPLPLDELEMVHDLINDDAGAGIQTWASITWNGGSAP